MNPFDKIAADLSRRYRYKKTAALWFGVWKYSYEIVGSHGGMHLHLSRHHYDNKWNYSAGLEYHSRAPRSEDAGPPSHDDCWLLKAPCWHDGTSLYAEEPYLPMFLDGDDTGIFRDMAHDADRYWSKETNE